jgi:DNA mismatch repair protein MutS
LAGELRAFTLFATHYFELTSLAEEWPGCANVHLDATTHGRELVFLHRVKPGPASQSYGLHVAELAGVPRGVIERARRYLEALEQQQVAMSTSPQGQLDLAATRPEPVLEQLAAVDVDALTPRAALELLYELVSAARAKRP